MYQGYSQTPTVVKTADIRFNRDPGPQVDHHMGTPKRHPPSHPESRLPPTGHSTPHHEQRHSDPRVPNIYTDPRVPQLTGPHTPLAGPHTPHPPLAGPHTPHPPLAGPH